MIDVKLPFAESVYHCAGLHTVNGGVDAFGLQLRRNQLRVCVVVRVRDRVLNGELDLFAVLGVEALLVLLVAVSDQDRLDRDGCSVALMSFLYCEAR